MHEHWALCMPKNYLTDALFYANTLTCREFCISSMFVATLSSVMGTCNQNRQLQTLPDESTIVSWVKSSDNHFKSTKHVQPLDNHRCHLHWNLHWSRKATVHYLFAVVKALDCTIVGEGLIDALGVACCGKTLLALTIAVMLLYTELSFCPWTFLSMRLLSATMWARVTEFGTCRPKASFCRFAMRAVKSRSATALHLIRCVGRHPGTCPGSQTARTVSPLEYHVCLQSILNSRARYTICKANSTHITFYSR